MLAMGMRTPCHVQEGNEPVSLVNRYRQFNSTAFGYIDSPPGAFKRPDSFLRGALPSLRRCYIPSPFEHYSGIMMINFERDGSRFALRIAGVAVH
ncbi:MAG: hypothetical protein ABI876_07000, partial [Bacteroidota bacterium]